MRNKLIAANWKMNTTLERGTDLLLAILENYTPTEKQIVICPPYTHLALFSSLVEKNTHISIGAQNCAVQSSGAYTGDISAEMIKPYVEYCIVGHSERRMHHNESNMTVKNKVNILLENKITPIFCCGEDLETRNKNLHFEWVIQQIVESLFHLEQHEISKVVIAYEPIWAIGTGETASSTQAQEMHAFIRSEIEKRYDFTTAQNVYILYGGSCNATNAAELFSQKDIDGGLIGGASLKAEEFLKIIE